MRPDSDWDIAVFLKEPMETEALRLADAGIDILLDTGAVINSMRLPAGSWDDRTGFMGEIRREGIMGIGLHRAAARSAYYAAFHAAEALIHARTGRAAKTHAGCAEPVRAAGPAGDGHRG